MVLWLPPTRTAHSSKKLDLNHLSNKSSRVLILPISKCFSRKEKRSEKNSSQKNFLRRSRLKLKKHTAIFQMRIAWKTPTLPFVLPQPQKIFPVLRLRESTRLFWISWENNESFLRHAPRWLLFFLMAEYHPVLIRDPNEPRT